jgi:hypothetical protein
VSQPRTWTLGQVPWCGDRDVSESPSQLLRGDDPVRVIELQPVLDLLEDARPIVAEWKHGNSQTLLDVEALLRSHGRLRVPAS